MAYYREPTEEQRKLLVAWDLDPDKWLVADEHCDRVFFLHRDYETTGEITVRVLPKGVREDG